MAVFVVVMMIMIVGQDINRVQRRFISPLL
jgi:hypothetical protein